jgi:hypothetical protein
MVSLFGGHPDGSDPLDKEVGKTQLQYFGAKDAGEGHSQAGFRIEEKRW